MTEAKLERSLGPWLLTFYGLGNILGAGIYVLIGKVAGAAGYHTPLAFLVSAGVAGLTALSYAELSARLPLSAGEAVYVHRAFGRRWLSFLVGLLIVSMGTVSAAAIVRGFYGYLQGFVAVPEPFALIVTVALLGGLAVWGIGVSVRTASLFTLAEIGGLLLVIYVAGDRVIAMPAPSSLLIPPADAAGWYGILLGAFIAFYAFTGFEDMVNVAEEVRAPQRTMPLAILAALAVTGLLYAAVSMVAVATVSPPELAATDAPLALIYERATGESAHALSAIALFAVVNGALIQIIMVSRVLYGMGRQGWLPRGIAWVHPRTRTPAAATALVTLAVILLALWLPLLELAKLSSFIILIMFSLVNLSLLRIKHRETLPENGYRVPGWAVVLALFSCLGLLAAQTLA